MFNDLTLAYSITFKKMKAFYLLLPLLLTLTTEANHFEAAQATLPPVSDINEPTNSCGKHISQISNAYLRPYSNEFDLSCKAFRECHDAPLQCAENFIGSLRDKCEEFRSFVQQ